MATIRPGRLHVPGKYSQLLNPVIQKINSKFNKILSKNSKSTKEESFFANKLKCLVLKQLKTGIRQSAVKLSRFAIQRSLSDGLQKKFKIGKELNININKNKCNLLESNLHYEETFSPFAYPHFDINILK